MTLCIYAVPVGRTGVTYNFRVTAVNSEGDSEPSDEFSVRVVQLPQRPSITTISVAVDSNTSYCAATVSWNGDENAGGYLLEYMMFSDANWTSATSVGTRYMITGMEQLVLSFVLI